MRNASLPATAAYRSVKRPQEMTTSYSIPKLRLLLRLRELITVWVAATDTLDERFQRYAVISWAVVDDPTRLKAIGLRVEATLVHQKSNTWAGEETFRTLGRHISDRRRRRLEDYSLSLTAKPEDDDGLE